MNVISAQEFKSALAAHLCGSADAARLIRRHDKNLSEADFSCPGHSRAELWRRFAGDGGSDFASLRRLCEEEEESDSVAEANEATGSLLKMSSARLNRKQEALLLRLDRRSALSSVISGVLERGAFWHPAGPRRSSGGGGMAPRFESCEMSSRRSARTTELSALRCSMAAGCLQRVGRGCLIRRFEHVRFMTFHCDQCLEIFRYVDSIDLKQR